MTRPPAPVGSVRRRRGFGAAFWSMIGFGLACIVAGVIIGLFGPRIFPKRPTAPAASLAGPALGKPPTHR